MKIYSILCFVVAFLLWFSVKGQDSIVTSPDKKTTVNKDLSQTLEIVQPYEPIMSNVYKIFPSPRMHDTTKNVDKSTTYNFSPIPPLSDDFIVKPIPSVKLLQSTYKPMKKINGLLRLGTGTLLSSIGDLYLENTNNTYSWGLGFNHYSHNTGIKNRIKEYIPANTMHNKVALFSNNYLNTTQLRADVDYTADNFRYYGFSNDSLTKSQVNNMAADSVKQLYQNIHASIYVGNHSLLNNRLTLEGDIDFHYFTNRAQVNELKIAGYFNGNYRFGNIHQVMFQFKLSNFNRTAHFTLPSNTLFEIIPKYQLEIAKFKLYAGFNFTGDVQQKFNGYFFPLAHASYRLLDNLLVPFIEISGSPEINSFQSLALQNPYIAPDSITLQNTINRFVISGGIRGTYHSLIDYRAIVQYKNVKNLYYFQNRQEFTNYFDVQYLHTNVFTMELGTTVMPLPSLTLDLSTRLYSYSADVKILHRPLFDVILDLKYNIYNKLVLYTNFMLWGKYYAINQAQEQVTVPVTIQWNIGANYTFFNKLSVFAQLNNITNHRNSLLYYYIAYPIHFNVGLSFRF